MRRTPALPVLLAGTLALSLGPALALSAASEARAGTPTCHDRAATVVGTPGGTVRGTDGPDVVVTNGAARTATGAGDDLVCVTGGSRKEDADVQTDDGDDVIDGSAAGTGTTRAYLGEGDDSYTGFPGPDVVFAGDPGEGHAGEGSDVVTTGAGADVVVTGGTSAAPDHDSIDVGAGRDGVRVEGPVDPALSMTGGAGRDELTLDRGSLRQALTIDNAEGRATADDVAVMTWSSMEDFRLTPFPRWEAPSFIGGDGPERVWTSVPLAEARMGGGDDRVDQDVWEGPLLADAFFDGGRGEDTFVLMAGSGDQAERVVYDRRNGSMLFERDRQHHSDLQVDGFDRFRWSAVTLEVHGTARPDHFEWLGCHGVVAGRGGDDVLRLRSDEDAGCGTYGADADLVTRGGPGDDRLLGNFLPDILIGGPGHDVTRGAGGQDRCVAETEVDCER
ncbi:hypothetical protein [Nocardioides sp. MH1]|uniref:hypothetical protein n=1 Tax=Nocardioides sp. MH1 TaxID=3242490 RepID=UPI003522422E